MRKIILTLIAVCNLGSISLAFSDDCGCQDSAKECTCQECNCSHDE